MKDKNKKIIKALVMTSMLLMQGSKGNTENNTSNSNENILYHEINNQGYLTANVNFRTGPDTSYESMNILNEGTIINILKKINNDWYLVEYNNIVGYISSLYVNIIDINKINEQVMKLPTSYRVLTANTDVNIRNNPSTNDKKIGKLKKGEQVIYSKLLDNDWYECIYKNEYSYVYGDYVDESYIINGECKKIVFLKNNSLVYDYPYSNEKSKIIKYELAKVYGEVDNYYYVESDGIIGFRKKNACQELNDKFIVVDISSQTITVYDNVNEILASKVVTGKNSTPTDLGYYHIYTKEKNRTLIGADYKTFVKYWMGFNGGEGFHDATWRSKFGGDIYMKKGSHGCVNLPENFAKELYNEVSVGDKVLIKK